MTSAEHLQKIWDKLSALKKLIFSHFLIKYICRTFIKCEFALYIFYCYDIKRKYATVMEM